MTNRIAKLMTEAQCYQYREDPFRLASGKLSNLYFDVKRALLHPQIVDAVGRTLAEKVVELDVAFAGGVDAGGFALVPLTIALVRRLPGRSDTIHGFVVRKKPKDHGTEAQVEGFEPTFGSKRVVLFEDVITTGGSLMPAIDVVGRCGAELVAIVAVVDRHDGDNERFAPYRKLVQPLVRKEDFDAP